MTTGDTADTVFREGDEIVLARGTYQGTPRADPIHADSY
jgi:hypothetical protein